MNSARSYYDRLASIYDKATEPPGAWTPPSFLANVISENALKRFPILDIGIGTGRSIESLYTCDSCDITGVDCSPKMLDICRLKYPGIKLIEGYFPNVEFSPKRQFQLIVSCGVFEFIPDLNAAITKAASLLGDGGSFVFTYEPLIEGHEVQCEEKAIVVSSVSSEYYVPDFYTYRHPPSTIRNYVRGAGLTIALDEEFVSYKKQNNLIIYHCILAHRS